MVGRTSCWKVGDFRKPGHSRQRRKAQAGTEQTKNGVRRWADPTVVPTDLTLVRAANSISSSLSQAPFFHTLFLLVHSSAQI
jgi:hypothetical protein